MLKSIILEGYYSLDKDNPLSIKEVHDKWVENGDKAYDADDGIHAYYPIKELILVPKGNELRNTPDSLKYKEMWNDILQNGIKEPIIIMLGKNGKKKIGEGNHRVHIVNSIINQILIMMDQTYSTSKKYIILKTAYDKLNKMPVRFNFWMEV
jgi:hypothetical protein